MIYTQYYMQGWNMVSIPCDYDDIVNPEEIFQNAVQGTLYGFDGTYVNQSIQDMQSGQGYWLNFSDSETVTFECDDDYYDEALHVHDIDGNMYQAVQIGDQLWMAENLRVTRFNNGDEIPTGHSNDEWGNLSTGAYGVYDDNEGYADTYGYLYNWFAVGDPRGICPEGWHVCTEDDVDELFDYIGGQHNGGVLKECTEGSCPESEYWYSGNHFATNETGFTALPGGFRQYLNGNYENMTYQTSFWTSTETSPGNSAWNFGLSWSSGGLGWSNWHKESGFSVRCVTY